MVYPAFKRFNSRHRVLQQNAGLEHGLGGMQWELAGCLVIAWVVVYLIIAKGLHSSGKIIWFTALFPYFVMFILLGRALTLPGPAKFSLKTKLTFQERSTGSGIMCTWTGPSCWTARPGSMVPLKSSSPTALGWERFLLWEATTSFTTTASGSITLSTFSLYQICLGNFSLAAYSAG